MEAPGKGTVTQLSSLFPAEEAQRASKRVQETIAEHVKELDQLWSFVGDNTSLINLVQKLPEELHHDIMVMALIAYLMEFKGNYGPYVIIVPNTVLVNWKSELQNWLPSISCVFYVGNKDERKTLYDQSFEDESPLFQKDILDVKEFCTRYFLHQIGLKVLVVMQGALEDQEFLIFECICLY